MYKVKATMHGERVTTDMKWKTREAAKKYAEETNRYRRGARARVVKL
jgi:hypothetical protein